MAAVMLITSNLGALPSAGAAVASDGSCTAYDTSGALIMPGTYVTESMYGNYGYADANCVFSSYEDTTVQYYLTTGEDYVYVAPVSCGTDYKGDTVWGGETAYWSGGGYTVYDENCNGQYYSEVTEYNPCSTDSNGDWVFPGGTAYWSSDHGGGYTVYDSECYGTWYSDAGVSDTCGTDDYGSTIYKDAWGYSSDGSYSYGWWDSSCSFSADSSSTSDYYCDTTYEGDLECSYCYEDGVIDSYSCWNNDYSSYEDMDYDLYYIDSNGMYCMEYYNVSGALDGSSCWSDDSYDYSNDSWYDRYYDEWTCYDQYVDCGYGGECWCETCYDSNGNEVDDSCDEYINDDGSVVEWTSETVWENGLECTYSYQDDELYSLSCWDDTYDDTMDYGNYYIDSNGLFCSEWWNTSGSLDSKSCWEETGTAATTYDSWNDRYYNEWTCYNDTYDCGYGGECWCEACYDINGNEMENTCSDDSSSGTDCAWYDYDGNCTAFGTWAPHWSDQGYLEECMMDSTYAWYCQDQVDDGGLIDPVDYCTIDGDNNYVFPYEYAYWSDGSYTYYYDESCNSTYYPVVTSGDYCTIDDYGSYVYTYGWAYWYDGSYTEYDGNCNGTTYGSTTRISCGVEDNWGNDLYSGDWWYLDDGSYGYFDDNCEYHEEYNPDDDPWYSECVNEYDSSLGLECSTCTNNSGEVNSYSCWDNSNWNWESEYCDHYVDGDMLGMKCYDSSGTLRSLSEWEDYDDDLHYDCWDCDQWKDRYYENARCEYQEAWDDQWGYNFWCEVCTADSGRGQEIENTCEDNWEDDYWGTPAPGTSGGWTEYYVNSAGEDCTAYYDDWGNLEWEECSTVSEGYCTWVEQEAGWCEVCYTADGRIGSEMCDEGDGGVAAVVNERDAQDQFNEMQKSLRWLQNDVKEFSRFAKRLEHSQDDYERRVEYMLDDMEWLSSDGVDVSGLEALIAEMEADIDDMKDLGDEIEDLEGDFEDVVEEIEMTLSQASRDTNLTWEEMEVYWLMLRKGDTFQLLRDIYDMQINYYDMRGGYYEGFKEITKVVEQLEEAGVDIPNDLEDDFELAYDWFDEFNESWVDTEEEIAGVLEVIADAPDMDMDALLADDDLVWEVRDYYDWEVSFAWDDLSWARDSMNVFGWDNMLVWDAVEHGYRYMEDHFSEDWIKDEVSMIREEIEHLEDAFLILEYKVTDSNIQKKIDDVLDMVDGAYQMLDNIENQSYDDPYMTDNFWLDLDSLGQYIEPRVMKVMAHVEDNYDNLGLSGSEKDAVDKLLDMEIHDRGACYKCDRLDDIYAPDVVSVLDDFVHDDILNDFIQEITASVVEEVVRFMEENKVVEKIVEAVVANIEHFKAEKFEEGFADTMLENQGQVVEAIEAVDFDEVEQDADLRTEFMTLENMHEDFQAVPMPDPAIATTVAEYWDDVHGIVVAQPSLSELNDLIATGTGLYDQAVDATYEYHLDLVDVPGYFDDDYEDTWYAEPVFDGLGDRWNGYKDAEGNYTYEFGPSDTTLRAEALKMVLESAGHEGEDGGDYWYSSYEDKGHDLGLSLVDEDLTQPITRGETMRLIYELYPMDGADYSANPFGDVGTGDDWEPAVVLYEEGIITGQGDTGDADLYSNLNRAESAAVIQRAVQWEEGQEFLESDLLSYSQGPVLAEDGFSWGSFFASLGYLFKEFLSASVFMR